MAVSVIGPLKLFGDGPQDRADSAWGRLWVLIGDVDHERDDIGLSRGVMCDGDNGLVQFVGIDDGDNGSLSGGQGDITIDRIDAHDFDEQ